MVGLQLQAPGGQPRCARGSRAGQRRLAAAARAHATTKQHVHWTAEVAMLPENAQIEPLIQVLQAQGQSLVAPSDRAGLHPLLIPLTERPAGQEGQQQAAVTCLLRWPEPRIKKDIALPVVSMVRNAPTLRMLARSPGEYLHRAMAEEESSTGSAGAVAAAAGSEGGRLYQAGAYGSSNSASLGVYLTKKAGMFPDVAESLCEGHWARGDTMSALITAEWYMRRLPGWGRPFEYGYQLLQRAGRKEEARDTARVGLRQPWWTFTEGYSGLAEAACMAGDSAAVRAALEEQDNMSNGEVLRGMYKTNPKSDKQMLLEEAEWLMNRAAAGEAGWGEIREGMADAYSQAGLKDVARFILAA